MYHAYTFLLWVMGIDINPKIKSALTQHYIFLNPITWREMQSYIDNPCNNSSNSTYLYKTYFKKAKENFPKCIFDTIYKSYFFV